MRNEMRGTAPEQRNDRLSAEIHELAQALVRGVAQGREPGMPIGADRWFTPSALACLCHLPSTRIGSLGKQRLADLQAALPGYAIEYTQGKPSSFRVDAPGWEEHERQKAARDAPVLYAITRRELRHACHEGRRHPRFGIALAMRMSRVGHPQQHRRARRIAWLLMAEALDKVALAIFVGIVASAVGSLP